MQPTVRIHSAHFPDGLVINASDFDPAIHRRFEDGPPLATPVPMSDSGKPATRKKTAPVSDSGAQV